MRLARATRLGWVRGRLSLKSLGLKDLKDNNDFEDKRPSDH